jgi:hypothetical protein
MVLLVLAGLAVASAAVEPDEFMRPCRRQDLLGVWRLMRLGMARGAQVDRTDPIYLPHQRYVFHSNATMAHVTQEVPFTPEEQRGLGKTPTSATWALESGGTLIRQRDGDPAVEKSECRVITRAVKTPGTTEPTAQAGDLMLTEHAPDDRPIARRLLRRIGSAD